MISNFNRTRTLIIFSIFLLNDNIEVNAQHSDNGDWPGIFTGNSLSENERQIIYNNISNLPVMFRKNMGQWDDYTVDDNKILYKGSSPGWNANIYFLKDKLSFAVVRELEEPDVNSSAISRSPVESQSEYLVWNLHFKEANPNVNVISEGKEDSHTNYLLGNDFTKHRINVPDFRMISYENIYHNIDINYYSSGKELKYDYVIKPGGEINVIRMQLEGVEHLNINDKGQLEITTVWGTLLEELPESYQLISGRKQKVSIEYRIIDKTTFGFILKGDYDPANTLVIDPVILAWSTFLGGTAASNSYMGDIALDAVGNVYGATYNDANFPITAGVFQPVRNGARDAVVFKLNPTGTAIIYSTNLGGSGSELGYSIAVTASNEVIIAGNTDSPNFPVTAGAFQPAFGGGFSDVFISKLNATGSALIYSTYLGGVDNDDLTWMGDGLAINSAGEAFVTGVTASANFPVKAGSFDTGYNGVRDGFVTKLNPTGTALIYSTFLGGTSSDNGSGIAIDAAGAAYVTGSTGSINFPTTAGSYDNSYNGAQDAFVTKLNAAGSGLVYSTYVGGFNFEEAFSIAVNPANEAFVVGTTQSINFPITPGVFNTVFNMASAFVFRLNNTGSTFIYSVFLGHANNANGIAVNNFDEAYITGNTNSAIPVVPPDYPTTSCAFDTSPNGGSDFFLSKLNSTASILLYSTYIGGNNSDYSSIKPVLRIGGCGDDEVVMCGTSHSGNFPTTAGVVQPSKLNGIYDQAVIFKFKSKVVPNFSFSSGPNCNVPVQFTDMSSGNCVWKSGSWTPTSWKWFFGDGTTSYVQNPSHVYATGGTYNVKLVIGCPADSIIIPVTVTSVSCCVATLNPTSNVVDAKCGANNGSGSVTVTGGTSPYTYSWSPTGGSGSAATGLSQGTYSVLITDGLNCKTSVNLTVNNTQMTIVAGVQNYLCNGKNNGTSSVLVMGTATPPYTYSWSNGQTTQGATGLSAGNYTVTVRDATGCSLTKVVAITQQAPIAVTVTPVNGTCGNPGTATATAIGGGTPYTYSWSNGQLNSATGLVAGTYSVTATDAGGCTGTKTFSITVAPNPASATFTQSPAGTVCIGTAINFTNTGTTGTYNWVVSPITPANVSGTTVNFSYTFLTAGSYSISHTVWTSGCSANATGNITVINCTSGPTVTATGSAVCPGNCGVVTASGAGGTSPYTYSWSNTATTQNIAPCPVATTTYTVTIKDAGGNTSTSTAVVTVNPAVTVSVLSTNIACNGNADGLVTATGSGGSSPYTYSWSAPGGSTTVISGLTTGTYTVTITDNKGCTSASASTIISPSALTGQFVKGTANCVSCGCKEWVMVSASGGTSPYSYTWPDGYVNRYKNQLCPGSYNVNIKDKNGCSINVSLTTP
ncbi:MAG: PKD domain-containing protein [Bacteroidetes bacterium]|nr:PKD domain-containing protein [Bacteroidota bacterium]